MYRRAATFLVPAACVAVFAAGLLVRTTSAAFTANTAIANAITVDALANYFSVDAGTDVQPGTSTRIASGNVDTLSLAFGTVPSARTFSSVFTITNVSAAPQTAVLTLTGAPQIASAVFAKSGAASVSLAAGESTTLVVTTSTTVAGRASGTLRLGLAGFSWLYRDYALTIAEAPEAPSGLTAAARAAGRIQLAWGASATTTNLAGYDLYRSSGSGWTKLNSSPLAGSVYNDIATVDGTTYSYRVEAVSTDAVALASLDSNTATATADATPPSAPTGVSLANGGGSGNAYVNAGNAGSVSVAVTVPSSSLATDTVTVTLSDSSRSVSRSAPAPAGGGTVTVGGLDASSLADGTVSITATSADAAGNVSTAKTGSAPKDTAGPGLSGLAYTDGSGSGDRLAGSTESGASVSATLSGGGSYGPVTASSGSFNLTVANTRGGTVTYTVTAMDAAGNTSSQTQTWTDSK